MTTVYAMAGLAPLGSSTELVSPPLLFNAIAKEDTVEILEDTFGKAIVLATGTVS